MKKLLAFTFALLFIAGTAYAQDPDGTGYEATVDQDGSDNNANVEQTLAPGADEPIYADITQEGNRNDATIDQVASAGNKGDIVTEAFQRGDRNVSRQAARNTEPAEMYIRQVGNGNFALQDLGEPFGGSNEGASNVLAEIEQRGNGNRARQASVTGASHDLSIRQFGNNDFARQSVTGDGDDTFADGTADILQNGGSGNRALQFVDEADDYTLSIDQFGSGNFARMDVTQSGAVAEISQNGTNNNSTITQQ